MRRLLLGLLLLVGGSAHPRAEPAYPVGIRAVEFVTDDHRTLALHLFYPAAADAVAGPRSVMPFYDHLDLFRDAPIAEGLGRTSRGLPVDERPFEEHR